jgi:hypothetical protein
MLDLFLDYLFILICILYSDFLLYGFVFSSISRYLIFLIAYNLLILSITSDNMNFEFQIIREFNYQNVTIFPNQFFLYSFGNVLTCAIITIIMDFVMNFHLIVKSKILCGVHVNSVMVCVKTVFALRDKVEGKIWLERGCFLKSNVCLSTLFSNY